MLRINPCVSSLLGRGTSQRHHQKTPKHRGVSRPGAEQGPPRTAGVPDPRAASLFLSAMASLAVQWCFVALSHGWDLYHVLAEPPETPPRLGTVSGHSTAPALLGNLLLLPDTGTSPGTGECGKHVSAFVSCLPSGTKRGNPAGTCVHGRGPLLGHPLQGRMRRGRGCTGTRRGTGTLSQTRFSCFLFWTNSTKSTNTI